MRVIKAKMRGKEAKLVADERPRDSNVINLMERLRESLGQSGKGRTKKTAKSTAKTPAVRAHKQRRKGHAAA